MPGRCPKCRKDTMHSFAAPPAVFEAVAAKLARYGLIGGVGGLALLSIFGVISLPALPIIVAGIIIKLTTATESALKETEERGQARQQRERFGVCTGCGHILRP